MKKGLKRFLRAGGLALGGLVLLALAAVLLVRFDKPLVKRLALEFLARRTGIALEAGTLDYELFPLRVAIVSARATYRTPGFSVEVHLRRLEARGSLGRLIRGEAPAFDSADIEITGFRFIQTRVAETPIDPESIVRQTREALSFFRRITVSCGDLSLTLPGLDLRFRKVGLSVTPIGKAGAFGLVLDAGVAGGATRGKPLTLEGRLHAEGFLALGRTTGVDLRLSLEDVRLAISGTAHTPGAFVVEARGDWRTGRDSFRLALLALGVPGIFGFRGSGELDLGGKPSADIDFRLDIESLARLQAVAASFLPRDLRRLRTGGQARIEGRYSLSSGQPVGRGTAGIEVELKAVDLTGAWNDGPASVRISGRAAVSGPLLDPRMSGEFDAALGRVAGDGFEARKCLLRLKADGTRKAVEFRRLEAAVEGLSVAWPGKEPLAANTLGLKGSGTVDFERRSIEKATIEARLPGLAPVRLSGRIGMAKPVQGRGSLEGRGMGLPALRGLLAPLEPPGIKGWPAEGALDITLEAELKAPPAASLSFAGGLALSGGKFNDPDFLTAGEGLRMSLQFEGSRVPGQEAYDLSATLDLDKGAALWKDVYVSWDKSPLKLEGSGRFVPASSTLAGLRSKLALSGVGEVEVEGDARLASPSAFALRSGTRLDLRGLLALWSEAASSSRPSLSAEGGLSGGFALNKNGPSLKIKGRVELRGGALEGRTAGLGAEGITGELPVDLTVTLEGEAAPAGQDPPVPERGGLRIESLKTPSRSLGPVVLALRSLPNVYEIDPVSLDYGGVRLELGGTKLRFDAEKRDLRARTSLTVPDFDLASLVSRTSGPVPTGRARARFPVINITPAAVAAEGEAELDIFGGRVLIRNVGLAEPLTSGRELSCDVDLEDLDLKKVTDIVPFGEVTGVIRGSIRGLTVSYGEVESFDLRVESVPRKGVAQTFSLKAVDNLTILSTGQAAAAKPPFWTRFIRGFRYGRIGIRSTLANDTFTINGTIHENGREYLVRKSGLLGIDIINRMPEAEVSFKDMRSRLARIGRSENAPSKEQEEK